MPQLCPSCTGSEWKRLQKLRNQYTLLKCRTCGLLRSEGTPRHGTGEDEFGALDLDTYFKSLESLRRQSARNLLEEIEKHVTAGAVLDIGCSFGWFLDAAAERGWQTFGIEPSDVAVRHVQSRSKHEVKHGLFPETSFGERRFEAVVLTDVLEHLPDPVTTLAQIAQVLKPGGVLGVRVPNQEGLIYKAAAVLAKATAGGIDSPMWRMWQLDFPYPHLWYFSPQTLSAVTTRAGYDVVEVQTEPVIRLGGVSDRVKYIAGNEGSSAVRNIALTFGLGTCAVAANLFRMHDECFIIARPQSSPQNA